jgi:hypothetical protein
MMEHTREGIKYFLLTEDELKKIKGTHGFNSWRLKCSGCGKEFTDDDIGGTVVSVPKIRKTPKKKICPPFHPTKFRYPPKFYYHLKCFNDRKMPKEG